jgi:hypothetical protein
VGTSEIAEDAIPDVPGVYIFYGENNTPLYVGKSVSLRSRVLQHFGPEQMVSLATAGRTSGAGNTWFRIGALKLFADGTLGSRTAALLAPYDDAPGAGLDVLSREELFRLVSWAAELHMAVAIHAIGDRAVRNALDAIEVARDTHGPHDLRHHLAHVQIVQPEDIPRFRALDAVANCQTLWAQSDPQMTVLTVPFLGQERVGRHRRQSGETPGAGRGPHPHIDRSKPRIRPPDRWDSSAHPRERQRTWGTSGELELDYVPLLFSSSMPEPARVVEVFAGGKDWAACHAAI